MPPLDDLRKHDLRAAIRKFLRVAAVVSFLAYCLWNVYWLAQGQIPPSIFRSATGLPAPTTGGTRAVIALCRGEALESLRYNAMAIPILLLFTLTIGWLGRQAAARRRLLLPFGFFWAWLVVLAVAWVLKLTGDPMYW
jgi:hypothetical protein